MAPHVSENLSRIRKSASELNQLADEATTHIRTLNRFFDQLQPGIEVIDKEPFHRGRDRNSTGHVTSATYRLAYARDDSGKFGLVVCAETDVTDKEGRSVYEDGTTNAKEENVWVRQLEQASRALRVSALARLPEFIDHLTHRIEGAVVEVRQDLDKVKEAAAELKQALGGDMASVLKVEAGPAPQLSIFMKKHSK